MLTYHNDNLRTGQNVNESILTTANVNSSTFGKLFSLAWTPDVAQPLYMPGVTVGTQVHNLVFVATEHDSVYAWDADAVSSTPVWHASFINPAGGVTAIPCAEAAGNDCSTITPEFGITSTPVIDSSTGTLYVVASTKEVSGSTTSYVYRSARAECHHWAREVQRPGGNPDHQRVGHSRSHTTIAAAGIIAGEWGGVHRL